MEMIEKYSKPIKKPLTLRQLNNEFYNSRFACFKIKRRGDEVFIFGEMEDRPRVDIDTIFFNILPETINY